MPDEALIALDDADAVVEALDALELDADAVDDPLVAELDDAEPDADEEPEPEPDEAEPDPDATLLPLAGPPDLEDDAALVAVVLEVPPAPPLLVSSPHAAVAPAPTRNSANPML